MRKATLFFIFSVIFCSCLKADILPSEEVILEGLSKKKIEERVPFVKASVFYTSRKVFQKLSQMYSVDNSIKNLVFASMLKMNEKTSGLFSDDFALVIFDEFERLKRKGYSTDIHISYLEDMFGRILSKPELGYGKLINLIESNKENIVESITGPQRKKVFEGNLALTKQVIRAFDEKVISSELAELTTSPDFFNSGFVQTNIADISCIFWQYKCPAFFSAFFSSKIYLNELFSLFLLEKIASESTDVGVAAPAEFRNVLDKLRQSLNQEIDQFGKDLFSNE
jgi:hypothetical protein